MTAVPIPILNLILHQTALFYAQATRVLFLKTWTCTKIGAHTNHPFNYSFNNASTFSPGLSLTSEQISVLDARAAEFNVADHRAQNKIISDILRNFKRVHPPGTAFDELGIVTVRALSVAFCLLSPTVFLAYSPAHVW